jgi:hypothetical protein
MQVVSLMAKGYRRDTTRVSHKFFSKSFDGKKATVGSLEIKSDEASIASATGMPRIGKN